jgi:hypothetical protein
MFDPNYLEYLSMAPYLNHLARGQKIPVDHLIIAMKEFLEHPSFPPEILLYPLMEVGSIPRENYVQMLRDDFLRRKIIECLRKMPTELDWKLSSIFNQLRTSPEYTDVLGPPQPESASLSMKSHRRRRRVSYKAKKSRKTSSKKNLKNRSRK